MQNIKRVAVFLLALSGTVFADQVGEPIVMDSKTSQVIIKALDSLNYPKIGKNSLKATGFPHKISCMKTKTHWYSLKSEASCELIIYTQDVAPKDCDGFYYPQESNYARKTVSIPEPALILSRLKMAGFPEDERKKVVVGSYCGGLVLTCVDDPATPWCEARIYSF